MYWQYCHFNRLCLAKTNTQPTIAPCAFQPFSHLIICLLQVNVSKVHHYQYWCNSLFCLIIVIVSAAIIIRVFPYASVSGTYYLLGLLVLVGFSHVFRVFHSSISEAFVCLAPLFSSLRPPPPSGPRGRATSSLWAASPARARAARNGNRSREDFNIMSTTCVSRLTSHLQITVFGHVVFCRFK
jgi:hypothetical protein